MTFVLIPGAGGDAGYWQLVEPLLREHGHDAIAVDLPADDATAGLAAYADLVVEAARDRGDIVLVAQSMGALSAPLACDRLDVRALVLTCPMIPLPGETGGAWWRTSGQIDAQRAQDVADGRDPDAPFDVDTLFFHDVDPEIVERLMAGPQRDQSGRPFADPWPLPAWPDVPTHVVVGRHDRLLPLPFMQQLARDRLGVEPDVLDCGHLPALARPAELTRLLLGYERASRTPAGARG